MRSIRLTVPAALILSACAHSPSGPPATSPTNPPSRTSAAITAHDLELRLREFSDDSMMGRAAWTEGDVKAADYVAKEFARIGLIPAGENGGYFQTVPNPRAGAAPSSYAARNVIGILRGSDPTLAATYVSVTAHNDHNPIARTPVDHDSLRAFNTVLRPMGADSPAPRSVTPEQTARVRALLDSLRKIRPPRADSINNGADDDGSGTVAIIELAEAFARGPIKPRRSILFVSHTAEERGLVGSAWYTDHPTVPLDSIVAEFDLDMVGRGAAADVKGGGPTYLEVVGLRRISKEFGDWVAAANARETTPFVFNEEFDAPGHPLQYYCRADHYNYARFGIPSVSLSRGSHQDYHQVTDEVQYIDFPDYTRFTQMVFDATLAVADADHRPKSDVPKPTDPHVRCKQ